MQQASNAQLLLPAGTFRAGFFLQIPDCPKAFCAISLPNAIKVGTASFYLDFQ